ncbi:murein biosynthesis integral membrane protein MurJ [Rhodoferax sp. AJA081-3]|uniref:murein biosynthesis integral membrane protein MurJ n=1 Tax=Rhodoferax sp. AJA081-3 TaxID=2752316 RepID=UPI001ADF1B38|nr:murein biosynthesis integral membrane protein MurJ [Rhodoferax sp. AJA081-3]QTN29524.1 murein biosynthesis integral membrane protein MurJ [Rhodoferax sp. AJA081-3]
MSLIKSASIVSVLTLASRITGLVRDLLMASIFGVSAMTDAFWVAFRIPNLLRRMFAEGAFSQAFVPVLAASKEKEGEEATHALVNSVATLLTMALLLTCVVGIAGAPILVYLLASGMEPEGFEAAVVMTRWMFPYIACMSLVALGAGVLNTWKNFAIPAATPVLLNVAMILAAWLGAPWFQQLGIEPIYAMAAGVMLGGVLQLGAILLAMRRMGLAPKIRLNIAAARAAWAQPATKRIVHLMGPALLGVSVSQISLIINTQIASHLGVGSVTWLNNAGLLMEFPTAMLGVALGVVLMPQLAAAKAANDAAKFSSMIDWGLRLVVLMAVPSAIALVTFAQPLASVIFHNGAYTDNDVMQTSVALMGYGAGLLGLVAIKVLTPGYFASQNIKGPALIGLAVLVITQALNFVFVPLLAHAGLALAIGVGAMVNALWLLIGLLRNRTYIPQPGWGRFALQVLAASALLAVFLMWANGSVPWLALKAEKLQRVGWLALYVSSAIAIYFVAIWAAGLNLRQLLRR